MLYVLNNLGTRRPPKIKSDDGGDPMVVTFVATQQYLCLAGIFPVGTSLLLMNDSFSLFLLNDKGFGVLRAQKWVRQWVAVLLISCKMSAVGTKVCQLLSRSLATLRAAGLPCILQKPWEAHKYQKTNYWYGLWHKQHTYRSIVLEWRHGTHEAKHMYRQKRLWRGLS